MMMKNLIKWIISTITTIITLLLIYAIAKISIVTSFLFSWILNLGLMTWYSVVVSQINPKLNGSYFDAKAFERHGKIYEYLGIHIYRKLLVWIGWEKIRRAANPVKNDSELLKACEHQTRISELGHTLIAIIVLITTICLSGSLNEAKWLLIANLLLNIYPIMVQRFNRPRYHRLIKTR